MMNLRTAYDEDLSRVISWISDVVKCKLWAGPVVSFPLSVESLKPQISYTPENSFCIEQEGELVAFG